MRDIKKIGGAYMSDNFMHGINLEDGCIHFQSEIGATSRGCKISKAALRELENEPERELDFVQVFEDPKDRILEISREMIKVGKQNPVIDILG